MEADNRQRRQREREASEEGHSASEEGVTLGASKQDHSLGRHDDHTAELEDVADADGMNHCLNQRTCTSAIRRGLPWAGIQLGPFTSSFPSGHAASDLAFTFGAAQELPLAFVPLSACTMAVHWSLVRKRAHYPSDVLAGGVLGIAVALTMWKLWPPRRPARGETASALATHVRGDPVRREDEPTSTPTR